MIMTELQTLHERCPGEATDSSKPQKSRNRGADEGMRVDEGTDWFCFSQIVTVTTYAGFIYLFRFQSSPCEVLSYLTLCNHQQPIIQFQRMLQFQICTAYYVVTQYFFMSFCAKFQVPARVDGLSSLSSTVGSLAFCILVILQHLFVCVCTCVHVQRPFQGISSSACLAQLPFARLGLTLISLSFSLSRFTQLPSALLSCVILTYFALSFVALRGQSLLHCQPELCFSSFNGSLLASDVHWAQLHFVNCGWTLSGSASCCQAEMTLCHLELNFQGNSTNVSLKILTVGNVGY